MTTKKPRRKPYDVWRKTEKATNRQRTDTGRARRKIFVTRAAISKWETDKGYPSIDSLKQLYNLFGISIDELISDSDVENKQQLDKAQSRNFYICAMVCLAIATVCAIVSYFAALPYLHAISIAAMIAYMVFGILSKPKYKKWPSVE